MRPLNHLILLPLRCFILVIPGNFVENVVVFAEAFERKSQAVLIYLLFSPSFPSSFINWHWLHLHFIFEHTGTDTVPHDRGVIRALNSTYRPNEKVTGNPERTIFIGRLHIKTNEDTLCKKFEKFGKIRNCRVVRDIVTGVSKCYAFIEFKRSSSAQCAVNEMQKAYIDDCEIVVEHEFER